MRIGILGGTFDPIHEGHLALARAARKEFSLDKIFFVPAFIPPHKTHRRDLTPAPYRYRMVEMAIQGEPDFEISDLEFCRPEISYTVETLREFRKKYPEAELYLILGEDSLADIQSWREPEEIFKLSKVAAANRPGVALSQDFQGRVLRIPMKDYAVSSSRIREELKEGRSPAKGVIAENVEKYIQRMKLYRNA